jgi:hypothetical protein
VPVVEELAVEVDEEDSHGAVEEQVSCYVHDPALHE